jgi:acetamidase/formamidase
MDYNQLMEGTTLHFPVQVPGAYFYFGDGHAAQGDGESSGGAIETTLAVKFSVDVLPQQQIPGPRAESDEFYMAIGVGDPLDRAYQRATANMVHWLTVGFGLTRQEAYALIGTSARFDIASIVNERGNTIVCKIPKQFLRQIAAPAL